MAAKPKEPPPELPEDPVTVSVLEAIREELPDAVVESDTRGRHPWIRVRPESLRDVCLLLRDAQAFRYDCCHLISGVDWPKDEEIEVIYHLVSYVVPPTPEYRKREHKNDPWVAVKVRVPRDQPDVPTVSDIWIGADWHERETYDLMGVHFTGRKDLRRILLPEDWPGHPLRKDWTFPAEYHGIPIIPPEAQA